MTFCCKVEERSSRVTAGLSMLVLHSDIIVSSRDDNSNNSVMYQWPFSVTYINLLGVIVHSEAIQRKAG